MSEVTRYTPYHELPEWLTPEEVQVHLNLSRSAVYELIRESKLPSKKFGRLIRVPRTALAPEAGITT